jgi:hypothetical protein
MQPVTYPDTHILSVTCIQGFNGESIVSKGILRKFKKVTELAQKLKDFKNNGTT